MQVGGRWSSPGHRVLYTALDPATAILEVAVHKGFDALDAVHHKLLSIRITEPAKVHVLDLATIPNGHWLHPGAGSPNQHKIAHPQPLHELIETILPSYFIHLNSHDKEAFTLMVHPPRIIPVHC